MAKCPECSSAVSLTISDKIVCPTCKSELVGTFSKPARLLLGLLLLSECLLGIAISIVAFFINYPFFAKWLITGCILLCVIVVSLLLGFFIANKLVSFQRK